MPVTVQKRKGKGFSYVTVEKSTGKVKSHHKTKGDAEASARIRNAAASNPKRTKARNSASKRTRKLLNKI